MAVDPIHSQGSDCEGKQADVRLARLAADGTLRTKLVLPCEPRVIWMRVQASTIQRMWRHRRGRCHRTDKQAMGVCGLDVGQARNQLAGGAARSAQEQRHEPCRHSRAASPAQFAVELMDPFLNAVHGQFPEGIEADLDIAPSVTRRNRGRGDEGGTQQLTSSRASLAGCRARAPVTLPAPRSHHQPCSPARTGSA